MRRTRRLHVLHSSTNKCFRRLQEEAANVNARAAIRAIEVSMCRITIDTLNTWNNFCRAYYLSVMLRPRCAGGARLGVSLPGLTVNQAIEEAVIADNPTKARRFGGLWDRREEPRWYVRASFDRVVRTLAFSNYSDIQDAFSAGSHVFSDLPVFRNYFAHRNEETRRKATTLAPKYGIPATYGPSAILLTVPINGSQPLILDWIDELMFTAEYLCH